MIKRLRVTSNPQSGVALIVALLALLIISAAATGVILMANSETTITSNFRDEQVAFFAAKGGLEEIRDRVSGSAPNSINAQLPNTAPGTNNGVLYITNDPAAQPWNPAGPYTDDEICKETACVNGIPAGNPWYLQPVPTASAAYAANPALNWKWTRVTIKTNKTVFGSSRIASVDGTASGNPVCWQSTHEIVVPALPCPNFTTPVYALTTLAVTPSGSRRMLQQEVTSAAAPPLPAALVLDGYCTPNDANICLGTPHSNNYGIQGGTVPAIGTLDNTSNGIVSNALFRPGNFTGAGLATPSVSVIPSGNLGGLDTVSGVQALSDALQAASGCNASPSPPACGGAPLNMYPPANNPFIFVSGDSSNCNGTGIMVVTGTLTCAGNTSFNGLVFVIGQGHLVGRGGGNGQFTGGIFIAKTRDANGNLLPTLGEAIYDWNGGGGNGLVFDGSWSSKLSLAFGYRVLAQREMMY